MENKELGSFITIPRKVASDYRNRLLNRQERDVYVWLRMIANPYGIATVELESVAADCFGRGTSANYANKILLALKRKRYIYYEERSGRRGSFEVHLGEWPLPRENKSQSVTIKRLDKYFDVGPVRGGEVDDTPAPSEDDAKVGSQSQRSKHLDSDLNDMYSAIQSPTPVRPSDTDTNTDQNNDTSRIHREQLKKELISVQSFVPTSWEEQRCKEIALSLGETHINFLLSALKKHGFTTIERAWGMYREDKERGKIMFNPAAYFNGMLKKITEEST